MYFLNSLGVKGLSKYVILESYFVVTGARDGGVVTTYLITRPENVRPRQNEDAVWQQHC